MDILIYATDVVGAISQDNLVFGVRGAFFTSIIRVQGHFSIYFDLVHHKLGVPHVFLIKSITDIIHKVSRKEQGPLLSIGGDVVQHFSSEFPLQVRWFYKNFLAD